MILTCPQCQAQYKLNPAVLGVAGRDVRCVSCSHTWFQIPETAIPEAAVKDSAATPAPPQESSAQPEESSARSITDALQSILEKDGAAFEAVLSTVARNEQKKSAAAAKAQASDEHAAPPADPASVEGRAAVSTPKIATSKTAMSKTATAKAQTLPQETVLPIVTHNPLGMGANVFGGMVFLFCSFLTLAVVFIGKTPILKHWPHMAALYKTLGFNVQPPGAGLKFSNLAVERRIDDKGRTLVISAQMANETEHAIAYPPLRVVLKSEDGTVVKAWNLKTGVTQISGGDIVPVMMQLDNTPADGSTVELRVKGK